MIIFILLAPIIILLLPFLGIVLIVLSPVILPAIFIWSLAKLLKLSFVYWASEAKYEQMVVEAREKLLRSADELELKLAVKPKTTPNKIHLIGSDVVIEEFSDNEFRFTTNGEDFGYKFSSLEEAKEFITD